MTVTAYGEKAQDAVDAAEAEIERLDTLLSTGNADSEIVKLNEQKSATLSEDGGYLVKRALELNKETDGAFDIALIRLWRRGDFRHRISVYRRLMNWQDFWNMWMHRRFHTIRIQEKSHLKMTR